MSKKKDTPPNWHPETRALHAGWHPDEPADPVVPSWEPSTVFTHPQTGLSADSWSYTRLGNPNRTQLESALASLEGGKEAVTFASGMAAVQAVFHMLQPGDHVLLPDDLYHGVRNLILGQYRRWGLTFDFVDMTDIDAVEKASGDNTRLLWMESPSNPMLKITDIAGLAGLARNKGWLSVVDNTWMTPVMQRPLDLGADVVLYSTTKYIGGHSDSLGGALVLGDAGPGDSEPGDSEPGDAGHGLEKVLRTYQIQAGAVPSPFDCWMLIRSLKTLYARVRTQSANAQLIAGRLFQHHAVEKVYYPGLSSHAGQDIASRQMEMPGAMISFQVKGDAAGAMRVVSASKLIIAATSLGAVESTWEHRKTSEYAESPTPENLIRLSVGIEHPEDIWNDIDQSLDTLYQKDANVNDFQ